MQTISSLTPDQLMPFIGLFATEDIARHMLTMLQVSGYETISEVPDPEWDAMVRKAVAAVEGIQA